MIKEKLDYYSTIYQVILYSDEVSIDLFDYPNSIDMHNMDDGIAITFDEFREIFAHCPQNEGKNVEDVWLVNNNYFPLEMDENGEFKALGINLSKREILVEFNKYIEENGFEPKIVQHNVKDVNGTVDVVDCLAFDYDKQLEEKIKDVFIFKTSYEYMTEVNDKGKKLNIQTNMPISLFESL